MSFHTRLKVFFLSPTQLLLKEASNNIPQCGVSYLQLLITCVYARPKSTLGPLKENNN